MVYPSLGRDDLAEAKQVVSLVQQAKQEHPDGTTAIIVRSRSHLVDIIVQLQKQQIAYQAVEIEGLSHRPVVQDLLALTRALHHSADRIAWLSVLRAPYCGLTLEDLFALAGDDHSASIIDLLHQQQRIEKLSEDGKIRLARVLPAIDATISQQSRSTQRSTVEGAWLAMGGPACVANETDSNDAEVYFQLLEELNEEAGELDLQKLAEQVDKMFALADVTADGSLQIITIHKAKGLEFDTVIMPGLGRTPPPDKSRLLHWLEFDHDCGANGLLLAPINALGDDKNKTAEYLQMLDKEKRHYEDGRLLYVAATRTKR
ncbi:MAG: DNA helicase UvrD, partial [Gammaproteobacteria bacterium]|nr:DNA helicase UvrD [Gammaproteobacteria bacterium]